MSVEYDIDEILVDAEKNKIETANLKIEELRKVIQIFRVEERSVEKMIRQEIDRVIVVEQKTIRSAWDTMINHFREVIA